MAAVAMRAGAVRVVSLRCHGNLRSVTGKILRFATLWLTADSNDGNQPAVVVTLAPTDSTKDEAAAPPPLTYDAAGAA